MNHLSRSYLSLVCWLLSLIPPNFDQVKQYLLPQMSCPVYPETFPPFHVIGMQQLWVNESLCLAILVCPSPVYCLQKDDKKELSNLRKTKVRKFFYCCMKSCIRFFLINALLYPIDMLYKLWDDFCER